MITITRDEAIREPLIEPLNCFAKSMTRGIILLKQQLLNVHSVETRLQISLIIARYRFPLTVTECPSKNKGWWCHAPKSRTKLSLAPDALPFLNNARIFWPRDFLTGDHFPRKAFVLPSSSKETVNNISPLLLINHFQSEALTESCKGGNRDHIGLFSIPKNILDRILGKGEEPISFE